MAIYRYDFDIRSDPNAPFRAAALGERMRSNRLLEAQRRQGLQMRQRELDDKMRRYGVEDAREAARYLAGLYQSTATIEDETQRQAAFARGLQRGRTLYPSRNGVDPFGDVTEQWEQREYDALAPFMEAPAAPEMGTTGKKIRDLEAALGRPLTAEEVARAGSIAAPQVGTDLVEVYDPQAGGMVFVPKAQARGRLSEAPLAPGAVSPEEEGRINRAMKIQDRARKELEPVIEASNAASQVVALLNAPGAVSDVAAIDSFIKVLDPRSVIRDPERRAVAGAAGLWDQIQSLMQDAKGEGQVTEKAKRGMLQAVSALVDVYREQDKSIREHYTQQFQVARAAEGFMPRAIGFPQIAIPETPAASPSPAPAATGPESFVPEMPDSDAEKMRLLEQLRKEDRG